MSEQRGRAWAWPDMAGRPVVAVAAALLYCRRGAWEPHLGPVGWPAGVAETCTSHLYLYICLPHCTVNWKAAQWLCAQLAGNRVATDVTSG